MPDGRQARGALPRARTSRRATGARPSRRPSAFDEEGFYCSGDAVQADRPGASAARLRVRRPHRRGLQAATGTFVSVGPLRAKIIAAGDPLRAGRRDRRHQPQRDRRPASSRASTPAGRCAGLPADAPAPSCSAAPAVREFFQRLVERWRERHRQRDAGRARARARRAAVDRPRRNHRQGLDQPACGADAPRRRRRAAVPRPRPRRDRPARSLGPRPEHRMAKTTLHRVTIQFGDCDPAGIVFYPNFQRWIDAASLSFFMQCGVPPWRELVKTRGIVGTPLLEISTRFVTAATYAEELDDRDPRRGVARQGVRAAHRVTRGDDADLRRRRDPRLRPPRQPTTPTACARCRFPKTSVPSASAPAPFQPHHRRHAMKKNRILAVAAGRRPSPRWRRCQRPPT